MLPGVLPENQPRLKPEEIPVVRRAFPQPVASLHQIEITSDCNLRCPYCPSHKMGHVEGYRGRVNMTLEHFTAALEHAKYFVAAGTQRELNLAGIGESTMHPQFASFVEQARMAVGWAVELTLATNGLVLAREDTAAVNVADALARYGVTTYVSQHRPEKAGPAIRFLQERGVRVAGASTDPALNGNDWAGQVEFRGVKQAYAAPCIWIRQSFVMAMSDGRVTACCLDAKAAGVVGHVNDAIGSLRTKPYSLCAGCHQHLRVEGLDQKAIR